MPKKPLHIVNEKINVELSNVYKHRNSLEEWRTELRKRIASVEDFIITEDKNVEDTNSYFLNDITKDNLYKVTYRGVGDKWNYCSCRDFKLNQLGTCKHIETVKQWLELHHKRPMASLPSYTSVYLSYRSERKICIRFGTDNQEEFIRLATQYFNTDHVLKEGCIDSFPTFLLEAHKINNTFKCAFDVLQYLVEVRSRKQREHLLKEKYGDDALEWLLHTTLYPYQKEGIRFAVRAGKCIIADQIGLGKKVQTIGAAEVYRTEGVVSSVLIVCPASLKYQWKKEIERFTDSNILIIEGDTAARRKELYDSSEFYKIVSYNNIADDMDMIYYLHTDMLILDEVQRLGEWDSRIYKRVSCIDADYLIVLSNTLFVSEPQKLYSIVRLVDQYKLGPYYKFLNFVTAFSEKGQVIEYKNMNVVKKLLTDILLYRRKHDVAFQLPQRSDKTLFVSMTRTQRERHDEFQVLIARLMIKWRQVHFLSEIDRRHLLILLNRMRMVCDSTYLLKRNSNENTKIDVVVNLVYNVLQSEEDKVAIFSQWEDMTNLICTELDKKGILYVNLNGSISLYKRKELLDYYTSDAACRVLISTDAGNYGINLQATSIFINVDLPWTPNLLEQRISSVYPTAEHHNIQIINIISEQSIEERMLATLNFKFDVPQRYMMEKDEDLIFLSDKEFNEFMESLDEIIDANEFHSGVYIKDSEQIESTQFEFDFECEDD